MATTELNRGHLQWWIQDLWKGRAGNVKKSLSGGGGGGGLRHIFSPLTFFLRHLSLWGIVGVPSACQTDLRGEKQKKKRPPPPWIRHWSHTRVHGLMPTLAISALALYLSMSELKLFHFALTYPMCICSCCKHIVAGATKPRMFSTF